MATTSTCLETPVATKNETESIERNEIDTQNWKPPKPNPTSNIEISTSPLNKLERSPSLQEFFRDKCTQLVSCPNPSCDYFFESSGVGVGKKLTLPNGSEPSNDAVEHYRKFRYRCRKCSYDFCSECKKMPYHEGFTCEEYISEMSSVHCRFCDKLLEDKEPSIIKEELERLSKNVNTIVNNTCEDCKPKLSQTHAGTLPCGHQKHCTSNHLGSCYPCLHPDCVEENASTLDDDCLMCGINRLKNSPIIKLKCSHVFHYQCVINRFKKRWDGNEINLKFTKCPLCNQKISAFFKQWDDNQLMNEISALKQHLQHLISNQAKKSDITISHPESSEEYLEEGLRILSFYECHKCNSIYFGGLRVCGESHCNAKPDEFICGSCRNNCKIHGEEHMIYKCRFCCATASYFCFGHTHFCENCHARAWELLQGSNPEYMIASVAQCNGKESCPLKIDHPPNGEEFAMGCALCKTNDNDESKEDIKTDILDNIKIEEEEEEEVKNSNSSKTSTFDISFDFNFKHTNQEQHNSSRKSRNRKKKRKTKK